MTSRDFCFWLQGFFELRGRADGAGPIDNDQATCIRAHLSMVFKHEIDPSMGSQAHQGELNKIHQAHVKPSNADVLIRC